MPPADPRIRVIILDFDGVVIESNDVKVQVFHEIFDRFPEHAAGMRSFLAENISAPRHAVFQHLAHERLGRRDDPRVVEELVGDFSRRTMDRLARCELVPGAIEFLERFHSLVPLYLASVTPAADLERTVAAHGITRFFAGLYGCPPWTKPGAVRAILERESVAPEAAVLIGDSPGDLHAARETGVGFIARDSGVEFPEEPEEVYDDLFAVAEAIAPRVR